MTDIELLEKGYFPKELPPPFQTESFASKLKDIKIEWKKVTLSIEKKLNQKDKFLKTNFVNQNGLYIQFPKLVIQEDY